MGAVAGQLSKPIPKFSPITDDDEDAVLEVLPAASAQWRPAIGDEIFAHKNGFTERKS
jgi:hypothetical protein